MEDSSLERNVDLRFLPEALEWEEINMVIWLLTGLMTLSFQATSEGIELLVDQEVTRSYWETEERSIQRTVTYLGPGGGIMNGSQIVRQIRDKYTVLEMTLVITPVDPVVHLSDLSRVDLGPLKRQALQCTRSDSILLQLAAFLEMLQRGFNIEDEQIEELDNHFRSCLRSHLSGKFSIGSLSLRERMRHSQWRDSH